MFTITISADTAAEAFFELRAAAGFLKSITVVPDATEAVIERVTEVANAPVETMKATPPARRGRPPKNPEPPAAEPETKPEPPVQPVSPAAEPEPEPEPVEAKVDEKALRQKVRSTLSPLMADNAKKVKVLDLIQRYSATTPATLSDVPADKLEALLADAEEIAK